MNDQIVDTFYQQANDLVLENRRLRAKSEADDGTIALLKMQYDNLSGGIDAMIEEHKKIENENQDNYNKELRELLFRCDRSERAYAEIDGLLKQVGSAAMSVNELIVQAVRSRIGNVTPEQIADVEMPKVTDDRLPTVSMKS